MVHLPRPLEYTGVFFFCQAEDGMRDLTVTGVQTCALPIYVGIEPEGAGDVLVDMGVGVDQPRGHDGPAQVHDLGAARRLELGRDRCDLAAPDADLVDRKSVV